MITCRNAPIAPGVVDDAGFALIDMETRECRFPVAHRGGRVMFCAAEVDDWQPHRVNGSYCAFHRVYLRRQPSVEGDGE